MRRAARTDGNHTAVVKALRAAGCSVTSTAGVGGGFPDLAVGLLAGGDCGRRTLLLEVKDGTLSPSARKLSPDEIEWHANWRGEVHVIESVEQALALVGAIRRGMA
jgi:hypothetical protein